MSVLKRLWAKIKRLFVKDAKKDELSDRIKKARKNDPFIYD